MSQDPATETKIDELGLRYKNKVGGSPFGPQASIYGTMSCFKKSTFFCGDCRPVGPDG